jgi:hypothetical protein
MTAPPAFGARNESVATRRNASEWTLWAVALSCALHAAEEFLTGWQQWAPQALGIVMPTATFLVMNAVLVLVALRLARYGWRRPALSLIVPAATLVNGIFFHILPTVVQGHRSPGVYTAVLLYLPFSTGALVGAAHDGVPPRAILTAVAAGTLLMTGIVLAARGWTDLAPVSP